MFSGRNPEAKKALFQEIVKNLENDAGIAPADVTIILNDIPKTNWSVRNGEQASEIDLGFKTEV
jgi:phenylpyruvate tautomerase PptA (4-oxalocrotonate tautomerase family)